MKKKNKIFSLSIGVCIIFLGIICLAIPKEKKSAGEDTSFGNQLTETERENLEHKWMEKQVVSVLEQVFKIQVCEANINWSESKTDRADIKVTVSADNIGEDTLKTNIAECISRFLNISTENIVISFDNEVFL